MRTILFVLTMLAVCAWGQEQPGVMVQQWDGRVYLGRIVAHDESTIRLSTHGGIIVTIKKRKIMIIKEGAEDITANYLSAEELARHRPKVESGSIKQAITLVAVGAVVIYFIIWLLLIPSSAV